MHRPLSWSLTLLVAGMILAMAPTHAQRTLVLDDLIGKRYDADSGLPDESATAMVQTPDGFLWFGTFSGLARFDGLAFDVYTPANTPAMPDDGVVNLHLDRAGFLWCSTFAGIVRMKDGVWNRFGRDEGWTTDYARTFAEAPDGTLYVTGFDGKVLRLEGERFVELPPPPGRQQGALGHCDPEGRFWAVKGSFVGYLNGGAWKAVVEVPASGSDQARGGPARDGALWVIRGDDLLKVGASGVIARFSLTRPVTDFWSLYEHSSGEVWIASYSDGLFRVRLAGGRGEVSNYSRATGHGLGSVRFVSEDDQGNTWAGLNGMGLLRMRPRFFASYGIESGLPEPNVKSVTVDRAGQVWIGTYGAGVFRVDSPRFGEARFTPALPGSRAYVDSLLADRQGRVWVATFAPGSPVLRIEDDQTREILKDGTVNSSRSTLFEDSRGRVWLGGQQDLICCDGDHRTCHPLPEARALAEDPDTGAVWAATAHGLYRCDEAAFVEVMGPDGGSLDTGFCLRPESGGFLWIGTSNHGLLRRQPERALPNGQPRRAIKGHHDRRDRRRRFGLLVASLG